MNAQQLVNETPSQTFEFSTFWKSNNSSQVNTNSHQEDDKFVARTGNKHQQVCDKVFVTSFQEEVSGEQLSSSLHSSLTPRTLNYSKLNQARTNLQVQKDFKDLGIEVL